jgi:hypothetical protein
MTTTTINGWEYLTNVYPGNVNQQNLQEEYVKEHNLAYHIFIQSLCLTHIEITDEHKIYIDCNDDIINNQSTYYIKFTKTIFLKNKLTKIKKDLYNFYNPKNISVRGPYELEMNIYCIDLYKKTKESFDIPEETLDSN